MTMFGSPKRKLKTPAGSSILGTVPVGQICLACRERFITEKEYLQHRCKAKWGLTPTEVRD